MKRSEAGKLGWKVSKEASMQRCRQRTAIAVARFERENKRCPQCRTTIKFEKRWNTFCGHSCRALFHNSLRGTTGNCQLCGVRVKGKRKFCSSVCSAAKRAAETVQEIETSGVALHPITSKKFLAAKRGYHCALCGITEWRGSPLSLTLDHADGNPYNNTISNLRLLCPNCHSQTPSFTGKNRGNGRVARRERDRADYRRKASPLPGP